MSMHRTPRTGLVLCAIALLLAACGGGGSDGNATSPVPRGLGGPGNPNGHHTKHHHGKTHKPGKKHHHKGGPTSSSSPTHRPGHSSTPAPGHSSRPGQHSSSAPGGGGGGGSHTSKPPTHQPPAGPRVTVTPSQSLTDGQPVTVEGFGFKPNTLLVVAECQDRGLQTSQNDCNINNIITFAPGARVHSDANGHVAPVQITVRKTFKSVDCGAVKCLVAVSQPTLQPHPENEGDQYIHFQ
jgi:hypothetical protein